MPCSFRWRCNHLGAASSAGSCVCASVAGSPAGGRDGAFLTLDLVVHCSYTSGAEIEFWRPGTLCWSPVPSTLRQLENLSVFLGFSRLWIRFSSSHYWSLLHWRHLSMFRLAPEVDCCLSSPRAGGCGLLQRRRVPARVLMVACLTLLRVWRSAPSHIPFAALCIDQFSGQSWPILDVPLGEFSAGLCRFLLPRPLGACRNPLWLCSGCFSSL